MHYLRDDRLDSGLCVGVWVAGVCDEVVAYGRKVESMVWRCAYVVVYVRWLGGERAHGVGV